MFSFDDFNKSYVTSNVENFEKFKSSNFEYQIDDRPWVPLSGNSYLYSNRHKWE